MPGPLVSIVIPFLDPPPDFLREAVASVVAQDYRPLELLLVNDGSAAPAGELARQLAAGVGLPARYLEHEGGVNRGCSASRNLGASAARGEYIAFLDADDVWLAHKVAEQVGHLQANRNLAMVFGLTRYWFSWHQSKDGSPSDFIVSRGIKRERFIQPPLFVQLFLRGKIIVPSVSNTMIRRDAYRECGGFEERFRGMYEDQAFLVKLCLRNPVVGVPKCWDNYRQHPGSMTAHADSAGTELSARRDFLCWVREYCLEQGVNSAEIWEAVNKEVWLAGPASSEPARSRTRTSRRLKQFLLRLDEFLVPKRLRRRFWGQPAG